MSDVLKVLYVDDEPDIREVAVLALELDVGIEACAAGSGAEAMAILEADKFKPDVVLLDVMMPDRDGPAVLVELRAHGFRMPVIFITARAQSHELAHYLQIGAEGVITKPFDPMTLALELRAVMARAAR
jgi:two-component system OmpR family response regulator